MKLSDLRRNRHGIPVMPPSQGYYSRRVSRWSVCPSHHTQVYPTLAAAQDAKLAEGAKRVYRCRLADGYHIGGRGRRRP